MKGEAKQVLNRATRRNVGDAIGDWTIVSLRQDGPNAQSRRWVIQCKCGYQALRWENDLKRGLSSCSSCASPIK